MCLILSICLLFFLLGFTSPSMSWGQAGNLQTGRIFQDRLQSVQSCQVPNFFEKLVFFEGVHDLAGNRFATINIDFLIQKKFEK